MASVDASPDDSIFGSLDSMQNSLGSWLSDFGNTALGAVDDIAGAKISKEINDWLSDDPLPTSPRQEVSTQTPVQVPERVVTRSPANPNGVSTPIVQSDGDNLVLFGSLSVNKYAAYGTAGALALLAVALVVK